MAGKGESFLRINNAMYLEGDPKDFYNSIYQTAFKVAAAGKLDSILDESDTCPHNRWSKSAVTMHNHITGGILNGVSGGKLWLSDLRNKSDYDVSEFRKIVKEHVGFYDTLLNEVDAVKWCGPNAVLRNAAFQFNPGTALKPLVYNNWNATIIDRFGLPSQYGAIRPDTLNTLTADTVDSLDDTDIATVLSGRALVDGHAALKLADRGFARHLGCKPERKPFKTGGEHLLGSKWHCRFQNTGLPFLGDLAKGAVPLSEITVPPYRYAPTSNYVMPGAVYYENELGGKVITTSLSVNSTVYNYQGHDRKEWMIALLEKLDPGAMPLYMTALQNVYFKCGIRPDGNLLAAAYNLSYDELPDISLRGNVAVAQVEMLTGDGKWEKVCFEQNGRDIVVNKSLKCQEIAIFRITKRH
ncbi:MAG: hypothetical protein MJ025_04475 [Victivallaceae bacterium]|nr:hypothetical protein [Victivallaceae bacterium]